MRTIAFFLTAVLSFAGCTNDYDVDTEAPLPPQGIRTTSLDNAVELSWYASQDRDVAGYKVWVSDQYDGRYELVGRTTSTVFLDDQATNGVMSYYAVSAYDHTGNESALSSDVVYDTPRPEGYGVIVYDYRTAPSLAGYAFSSRTIGPYNDQYADVFYENANGALYLNVWSDTDIQDMGYTGTLDDISSAPSAGWSSLKSAEAIVGHTYVVWTKDDHYAKIRVREVSSGSVKFDWAYQTAVGNPELKHSPAPDAANIRPAGILTTRAVK